MSKPRWLIIHPFQLRLQRGIEVYLWNLALALAHQNVDIDIVTWAGKLRVPDYAKKNAIVLKTVPSVRYYQPYFAVPFYVAQMVLGRYGHVFVYFAGYGEGLSLRLARLFRRLPFSVVFHFPPSLVPHRYREFAKWGFHRNATNLIAVSKSTASEVEQWAGRHCEVIEHGVDAARFRPSSALRRQVRRQLGISQDTPVLISVAALEERKGIQCGLRALPGMLRDGLDVHYVIVGDGPYKGQLERLTACLAIQGKVHFIGAIPDVHPYLCAADIMLVLSRGEASSLSLLEALACRLPAVAADLPPFDGWVQKDWGIKVDIKDTFAVRSAISYLIRGEQARAAMGRAGRAYVKRRHTWGQAAAKYRELIDASRAA